MNFLNNTSPIHEEQQYLDLLKNILENGFWEEGRNGKTKSIFGHSMRFSLKNKKIPLLTTKKLAWKTCLKELLWFIKGDTDVSKLQKNNVHIWDENTSRDFLDSRGLTLYPENIAGPIYGYQWRNYNAAYNCFTGEKLVKPDDEDIYKGRKEYKGIDQLQEIIDCLKNPLKRTSRRLILTAWNPAQLDEMTLPPCHIFCQFNVHNGNQLSCAMYQRSCDEVCGQPFNIASYSFLTHLLAHHCGLEACEFVYFMGNCHIYEEHIEAAEIQIARIPFEFPTIDILPNRENIEKIDDYTVDDFVISNYKCHNAIKVKMVA
jgi:thymidylate synthase